MRISTSAFFGNASSKISDLQSSVAQKQTQIASGRRILTPADDPVAAAAALTVTQAIDVNKQFAANRDTARADLSLQESALSGYTDIMQSVKSLTISAGNGVLDDTQRKYIATELAGRYQDLLGVANTRDSAGNYIFGGFQNTTQPFTDSATGVNYSGDQGQRQLQVATARQLALNDSGDTIFQNIKSGDDTVAITPGASNTGTGAIGAATVTDATKLTHHSYGIDFTVAAGVTTYQVFDLTLDPKKASPLAASGTYSADPTTIAFDGLQVTASGAPATTDQFSIHPNAQSVFKTIGDLITALNTPASGAAGQKVLTTALSAANTNLSAALDTVLTVRAAGGARLQELDALDSAGDDRALQYASTLSTLQDLDYAKAVSDLTQQQVTLQAAQQSFVKIANLSLFNYLN